ncbi:peroxiredoxin-like family protein [Aquimarina algicola]|uniref:thioredoxin-dependent peroxiredoxin n=1 Tax=Aquimarina algicola TaxID=2589995 RepID=A0A504JDT7_9FLAO|nr:peroxiredoxin-like family protein [Aquimarina algicola]TPN84740.1 AhpC/TSA family protein [Aquimarina algicola]
MTLTEQLQQFRDATMTRMPKSIIQTFKNDIKEINASRLKENALQKGDIIPDFSLTDNQGNKILLREMVQSEFLILNFYRGGWCPYCNLELQEYERLKDDFKKAGADIIAISAEVEEFATQTTQKNSLSFPVLTDKDAQFMKAIGIVFQLNEQTKKDYAGFGMDFTKIHGNENYELPVPAVYVIDKNREIVFVHFEADYMTRIEPKQILTILKNKSYLNETL